MRHNSFAFVVTAALSLLTASCASRGGDHPAVEAPFEVDVRALGDADEPLAGVSLSTRPQGPVQQTDANGVARLRLQGRTGDTVEVNVTCPEGFVSPRGPLSITLYRVVDGAAPVERSIECERSARKVIAAIRAPRGARLPVMRFGHAIGETDDSGASHVVVEGKPGEHVDLTLATNDPTHASLRPQNPTLSFVIPERDGLLVLEQGFEDVKPVRRAPVRRRRVPAANLPSKI